ncbi:UNVERIFIED_CONTAM: putative mitochondrial protein [Sesamum radiatum]|uniref:Mitochondrial protein n=1 Tax=Sesamum radiatum TaxID=300843 RepID=A0AAW2VN04_SESRA
MNLGIATHIDNRISKFKDMEMDEAGRAWGASLCIRVALNINNPLKRALKIRTTGGDEHLVHFTYERLPNFCYLCGKMGHIAKYCENRFEDGFMDLGENMLYGPWLRAPPPSRGRPLVKPQPATSGAGYPQMQKDVTNKRGSTVFGEFRSGGNKEGTKGHGPNLGDGTQVHGGRKTDHMSSDYARSGGGNEGQTEGVEGLNGYHSIMAEQEGSKDQEGVGSPWTVRALMEQVKVHRPILVFLSKTKCQARRVDRLKERLNYNGIGIASYNKRGGLMLLWRKDIEVWLQSYSEHHIDATVSRGDNMERGRFSGFYGYPEVSKPRTIHEATAASDHSFVWVELGTTVHMMRPRKIRLFRFEAAWTKEESCAEVIRSGWKPVSKGDPQTNLISCIKECRVSLMDWNKNYFGNIVSSQPADGAMNEILEALEPHVTDAMNATLLRPFEPEEITLFPTTDAPLQASRTGRLKPLLDSLISPSESAFVPGRSIMDNVLIAYELNHYLRHKSWGKEGYVSLKLDVKRGLRKGVSLSPYLYLFGAEAFSAVLRRAERNGRLRGVAISRNAPRVSHLLFADDTLIFCQAKLEELTYVHLMLGQFERASGLKMNLHKSAIIFSRNVESRVQGILAAAVGIQIVDKHAKFLGLPTSIGLSKREIWPSIKERIWGKFNNWAVKKLSQAGRTVFN